jgi:ABC-type transport system involved in multi-copper enzyme maturation permease subunit
MKSIPLGKKLPAPVRTKTVFMGRMDFLNTLLRLIIVELYKIRRRAMSKVLISISIIISIAVFGLISLGAIDVLNSPIDNYTLPQCSQVSDSTQPCLNHPPTKAELTQAAQSKQEALRNISDPLRLPNSLGVATQVARNIGLILIIILAGTIVGGEYTVGTVRLMFTRGPTRTQFLLAKIGTIIA